MAVSWRIGTRAWGYAPLDPILMAIVNVTPDSFSDGGAHMTADRAADWARECIDAGATMLDVGGESTRPGAARVSPQEQISRVVPAISRMMAIPAVRDGRVAISVDTTHASVARAAIASGASIVNDVSGGTEDLEILQVVAEYRCGVVLMHRLVAPPDDSYSDRYTQPPQYDDVVAEVATHLKGCVARARAAGISPESIAVDPGLGFGKSVEQNVQLMDRIGEIVALGPPVLVSASRKSFLGALSDEPIPANRDRVSAQAAVSMSKRGVAVVRAHNVAAHCAAIREARAIAAPRHC